jgi:hypothetical protein
MNSEIVVEIVGWFGVLFYVSAYFSLSLGILKAHSYRFHFLNMLGAVGLSIDASFQGDWPNLVVNVLWLLIGILAVSKRFFTTSI